MENLQYIAKFIATADPQQIQRLRQLVDELIVQNCGCDPSQCQQSRRDDIRRRSS
jgi:hypothetical protein